jgi:hypothetical protein
MGFFRNVSFLPTPLWLASHLPLKGGDWQFPRRHPFCDVRDWRIPTRRLISPLEEETPGRAEGGERPVLARRSDPP